MISVGGLYCGARNVAGMHSAVSETGDSGGVVDSSEYSRSDDNGIARTCRVGVLSAASWSGDEAGGVGKRSRGI